MQHGLFKQLPSPKLRGRLQSGIHQGLFVLMNIDVAWCLCVKHIEGYV